MLERGPSLVTNISGTQTQLHSARASSAQGGTRLTSDADLAQAESTCFLAGCDPIVHMSFVFSDLAIPSQFGHQYIIVPFL